MSIFDKRYGYAGDKHFKSPIDRPHHHWLMSLCRLTGRIQFWVDFPFEFLRNLFWTMGWYDEKLLPAIKYSWEVTLHPSED